VRARAHPRAEKRDELTELMRDFDRMAERIEGLVDSQSRLLKDVSPRNCGLRWPGSVSRLGWRGKRVTPEVAPELESALNRIEVEADRLNQLIQRLLTISRLESVSRRSAQDAVVPARSCWSRWPHDAEYETPGRGMPRDGRCR